MKFFNIESIVLPNVKLFIKENLAEDNNTLAFFGCKLKSACLINITYIINGIEHIL